MVSGEMAFSHHHLTTDHLTTSPNKQETTMPNLKLAALAAVLAATGLAAVAYFSTLPDTPAPAYAEATSVAALAARVHSLEQIQKAQAGSLGGLQADMQKAQRALTSLTAPPPGKGKDKKTETGSVKLK